jgi:hypothetical protein
MITRRMTLAGATVMSALALLARAEAQEGGRGAEVLALKRFAETTHPRGVHMVGDEAWTAHWSALAAEADGLSFAVFMMRVQAGLAQFRDGHTTVPVGAITSGPFALRLPIIVRGFYDGCFVIAGKDDGAPLVGARVTRVAGVPINEAIRRFAAAWPADNEAGAHKDVGLMLVPGVAQGLGLISGADDTPIRVEAVTPRGRTLRATLRPSAAAREGRTAMQRPQVRHETWAAEANMPNYVRYLPDERAIYVACNTLDMELDAAMQFTRDVFAAMEAREPERLIIDLRRNGGGNNFHGEGLRRGIARSRFNRPGGLCVLTGPTTFSAAQNLANRLERETFAVFVGEPGSGQPNHYGDATPFDGQASGLRSIVSTLPWFDSMPMDRRRWVFPDVLTPDLFADFASGRDASLEHALTHRDERPLDELTRERVFYYERGSQSGEWKPFWME